MTAQKIQSEITSKTFPEFYIPDYRFPSGWKTDAYTMRTADPKIHLYGEHHFSKTKSKNKNANRALLIAHGRGEHCGRYRHFPQYLQENVDHVYTFDFRGHGRSGGIRGHVADFSDFVEDLKSALSFVQKEMSENYGTFEIHLFAHSMGGLITLETIRQDPSLQVNSVSLSAPLVRLKAKVPFVKKLAGYGLARIWKSLQIGYQSDPSVIAHHPLVQKGVLEDRLCHTKATPRFFVELMRVIEELNGTGLTSKLPTYFLISEDDEVVDPHAAIQFYEKMENPNKRLVSFKGFEHEMFNEYPLDSQGGVSRDLVFKELVSWIEENRS